MKNFKYQSIWQKGVKDKDMLKWGCACMHSRIRSMEFVVKVGTKKKAANENLTEKLAGKIIQKELKKQIGIRVNCVKQGHGNSNTGNCAKTFFRESEKSANILGINTDIIADLGDLLNDLNSTKKCVSPTEYLKKAHGLFDRLVQHCVEYGDLSPTIHRVIHHGHLYLQRAQELGIPLGCFSESALEMRNKDRRISRLRFSRKTSRLNNINDIYNYLTYTSDPYLNSLKFDSN